MSNKIFVGGLAWATTSEGLEEAFSSFGSITESKVITDRETGRSRGFGFVTFDSPESAQSAVDEMNGTELDGRNIRVDIAKERAPRGGGGGGGGGYRGGGGNRW